jgi:hypothetical protein
MLSLITLWSKKRVMSSVLLIVSPLLDFIILDVMVCGQWITIVGFVLRVLSLGRGCTCAGPISGLTIPDQDAQSKPDRSVNPEGKQ